MLAHWLLSLPTAVSGIWGDGADHNTAPTVPARQTMPKIMEDGASPKSFLLLHAEQRPRWAEISPGTSSCGRGGRGSRQTL